MMSGSGPSVFGIFENENRLVLLMKALKTVSGNACYTNNIKIKMGIETDCWQKLLENYYWQTIVVCNKH